MTDEQIKEIKEQIRKGIQKVENIREKYDELREKYKAKEQECEELKKIIDEAKNSKLDLKSFLVGEAVQNEYEQQLDQVKAEHSLLKDEYKILEDNLDSRTRDFEDVIDMYKQTLTEIKEIAEWHTTKADNEDVQEDMKQILQKCEVVDEK